ncbi:MAG: hypothetical protein LBM93_01935 [Oscillospiraceae bacterium]|jgi:hypothetical protein|nr:hypothetical protein [Oscillospiraceae bacterium]
MKYNLKSIIVSLVVIIIGGSLIYCDIYEFKTSSRVWINVGCSLIASGLVILLNVLLVEHKTINPLDEWGIEKIYETRAEKNKDTDPKLDNNPKQLDAVAFGLKSFRNKYTHSIETCLKNGIEIRILTMHPDNKFVTERAKEENEVEDQIKKSIQDLISWANNLNNKNYDGKIAIKGYNCMTLDFYWRVDNELYIGPYWYHMDSQQTITYKFVKGKKGFNIYSNYFENLWNNTDFEILTKN